MSHSGGSVCTNHPTGPVQSHPTGPKDLALKPTIRLLMSVPASCSYFGPWACYEINWSDRKTLVGPQIDNMSIKIY
eukprot:1134858-Pelagomonas_calceolata.AAC.1